MSSIARVIFLVDWTERIRRRRIRSWPPAIATPRRGGRPLGDCGRAATPSGWRAGLEARSAPRAMALDGVVPVTRDAPSSRSPWRVRNVLEQLGLEAAHVGDGDVVEVAAGAGVDRHHLLLDRHAAS